MNSIIPPFGTVNDIVKPKQVVKKKYVPTKEEIAQDLQQFLYSQAQQNPRLKKLNEKRKDVTVSIIDNHIDETAKNFERGLEGMSVHCPNEHAHKQQLSRNSRSHPAEHDGYMNSNQQQQNLNFPPNQYNFLNSAPQTQHLPALSYSMPFPTLSYQQPSMMQPFHYQAPPMMAPPMPMGSQNLPSLENYAAQLRKQLEDLNVNVQHLQLQTNSMYNNGNNNISMQNPFQQQNYQQSNQAYPYSNQQGMSSNNSPGRPRPGLALVESASIDTEQKKKQDQLKKIEYLHELERQIQEKKKVKEIEKALNRADDERVIRESDLLKMKQQSSPENHGRRKSLHYADTHAATNGGMGYPPPMASTQNGMNSAASPYSNNNFLDFLNPVDRQASNNFTPQPFIMNQASKDFSDNHHRKALISENKDPINNMAEERKKLAQNEVQEYLRKQIAEKEAQKRRVEELKKLEEQKEVERIQKEQVVLKERYQKELEEQQLKAEQARKENELVIAEKLLKQKQDESTTSLKAQQHNDQNRKNVTSRPSSPGPPYGAPTSVPFRSTSPPIPTLRNKKGQDEASQQMESQMIQQENVLPQFRTSSPPIPTLQKKKSSHTLPEQDQYSQRNENFVSKDFFKPNFLRSDNTRIETSEVQRHIPGQTTRQISSLELVNYPLPSQNSSTGPTSVATKQLLDQLQAMQRELLDEQHKLKEEIDNMNQESSRSIYEMTTRRPVSQRFTEAAVKNNDGYQQHSNDVINKQRISRPTSHGRRREISSNTKGPFNYIMQADSAPSIFSNQENMNYNTVSSNQQQASSSLYAPPRARSSKSREHIRPVSIESSVGESLKIFPAYDKSDGLNKIQQQQRKLIQQEKELEEMRRNMGMKVNVPPNMLITSDISAQSTSIINNMLPSDSNFIKIQDHPMSNRIPTVDATNAVYKPTLVSSLGPPPLSSNDGGHRRQFTNDSFDLNEIQKLNERRLEKLKEIQDRPAKDYLQNLLNI